MPKIAVTVSDVLGLGSGPQARQAHWQPKKSPAQPGPVVGPMRAQGCNGLELAAVPGPGLFLNIVRDKFLIIGGC